MAQDVVVYYLLRHRVTAGTALLCEFDELFSHAYFPIFDQGNPAMAKRRGPRGEKSEAIRELIRSGVDKPADVKAQLADRGIQVSTQMVYTVKARMAARKSARKIGRRREAAFNAQAESGAQASAPTTNIKTLARFIRAVHDVGGVSEARKILKEMEE